MENKSDTRYYLLQKKPQSSLLLRHFPPLEDSILIKVLIGAILEQCIVERKENDLDYLLNYILVLRTKLKDNRHHDLEVISTDAFQK